MKETILAIGAHNDDHLIGAGGALTKYASEGKRVVTVIFSYGELSHPHLKKPVIIKTRVDESFKADKIMGGSGVFYVGVRENHFADDAEKLCNKLVDVIRKEKPSKIFTHDLDDMHPCHRVVNRLVMRLVKEGKIVCPVYSFDVWSLVKLRKRNVPKLIVDTSSTFHTKLKAFFAHESQTVTIWFLLWKVIAKDFLSGFVNGYKYAEVFYKLK